MRKLNTRLIAVSALSVVLIMMLSGCGDKSGNTIDEPEITSNYLEDEYAEQLVTDGAETMIGYVDISKNDDTYEVHISEQEVVPNSDYEEGYYIADTNLTKDAVLGNYARIVCFNNDEAEVVSAEEFIDQQSASDSSLYTVYLMGDSAELILATDPEEVITK
ncbi:MAG: hypothetical protein ACI4LD_03185 [Lentihominibacter sp.]